MMQEERTLFFVKPYCKNPYIDKATALEVVSFLEDRLRADGLGEFTRVIGQRTGLIPLELWLEFYEPIKDKFPEIYWPMCYEFAGKDIALFVYQGPNIIQRVKTISGRTQYEDNIGQNTIREIFGNENMWYRTVVHASGISEVERDFRIVKKWNLLCQK